MKSGIYDFLACDLAGRSELVYNEGLFLLDYPRGNFTHHLFDMGSYFAEVITRHGEHEAVTIKAMRTGKPLDEFLDRIFITLPANISVGNSGG